MKKCHDCGAVPGEHHTPGCDVARCPRCGMQALSCDCVYIVNGMDPDTMEVDHPEIYYNGPTQEMADKFEELWGPKRLPWSGEWPGDKECIEYDFWCVGPPWTPCDKSTPGAVPHLNRLYEECVWDQNLQRMVKRKS